MKRTQFVTLLVLAAMLTLASCGDKEEKMERKMEKGFRLPTGDEEDGRFTFIKLKCHACHSVVGVDLPEAENQSEGVHFVLGGEVRKVKTYGELVTAIIKPQHVVSKAYLATLEEEKREKTQLTPMPNLNATMTVQELTDLVAFLHDQYQKADPQYDVTPYGP